MLLLNDAALFPERSIIKSEWNVFHCLTSFIFHLRRHSLMNLSETVQISIRQQHILALCLQPLSKQHSSLSFVQKARSLPEQSGGKKTPGWFLIHVSPRTLLSQVLTRDAENCSKVSTLYFPLSLVAPYLSLNQSLAKVCSHLPPWASPQVPLQHTHTHTECIRVAVIYNTAPLSRLDNGYKQTIDMEMERCSSLAGAACFVNG